MGARMLNWKNETEFEVGNILFTIDTTPGSTRRQSSENNFTLVKTKSYIQNYLDLVHIEPENVIELGLFQGGSLVFFDKIFKPKRLVGVELSKDHIPALDGYIRNHAQHIKAYYGTSQDDGLLLRKIVGDDLGGKLDLVVDDASHLYEFTKASFCTLFPLLEPGGVYVIEDWAWAHRPNGQTRQHPWFKFDAMTNLVFEMIVELAGHKEISDLSINNNMVVIKKSEKARSAAVLQSPQLRGRCMPLI